MNDNYKIVYRLFLLLLALHCNACISGVLAANVTENKKDTVRTKTDGLLILDTEPQGLEPRMNLSEAQRLDNFDLLAEAIDKNYSFFKHKNIDWPAVTTEYRGKVEAVDNGSDFYNLINEFIRELDCHSWICNYPDVPKLERYSPQMQTCLVEGKCIVCKVDNGSEAQQKGIMPGSVIVSVDGLEVEQMMQKIKPLMSVYSSPRCFEQMACRRILDGPLDSYVKIKFLAPGGMMRTQTLKRVTAKYKEYLEPRFKLNKGRYVWYGKHFSGYGYIRILSFNGSDEIVSEFDEALEYLKRTPGLIIDVRENTGGLGASHRDIIGRFITSEMKASVNYIKDGDGHDDFKRSDSYFYPSGKWQYTNPVALLFNEVSGSASDLFVSEFVSVRNPITLGNTTHGNLAGYAVFVQLPCDLVVRVSHGYVCDATGRVIEGSGTEPQIMVYPTIKDITRNNDPVIRQAIIELKNKRQEMLKSK